MKHFSKVDLCHKILRQRTLGRALTALGTGFVTILLGVGGAQATPILTEGSVLPNYGIVSVGPNASITINSGPINGNVLVGDGSTVSTSGGNNGGLGAGFHVDESGTVSGSFSGLQNPPTVNTVPGSAGTQAFSDAQALSTNAAGLAPTKSYTGTVSGPLTITGNGGLDVIDFANLQNPVLTLNGGAFDVFIFNVSGLLNTNQVMTLNGVSPLHILWNFTGTGTVFQTSGGDEVFGTFLATDGGNFQFSNLDLTGQLINTGGHVQDVSGSLLPHFYDFSLPQPVSEPGTLAVFGSVLMGFLGLGFFCADGKGFHRISGAADSSRILRRRPKVAPKKTNCIRPSRSLHCPHHRVCRTADERAGLRNLHSRLSGFSA